MIRLTALATLSCALTACGAGAPCPSERSVPVLAALAGDYLRVESRHVGRAYHVHVRLPEGYDARDARRYPVIYLLDGDSLFPLLAPTHLFLTHDEGLPEVILVGVSYGGFDPSINKRDIDFAAPEVGSPAAERGAPAFLEFLAAELIPAVEARYRVDPARRVLLGQSRGGTFALWTALERPDLFWARIASNPGLRPARERFFAGAGPHERRDLRVAVISGSRDTEQRRRDALAWTETWSGRPDAPWQVRLVPIEGGTHAASIGEGYRRALLWLFRDDASGAGRRDP